MTTKDGDRFLEELAQKRYEADKLTRLAIFKSQMMIQKQGKWRKS